ncbi:unnamed protein product [Closterium sp. Naga37s-1]|nr:unnamed protein product [Closterium sp. Naga37s-1]
MAVVVSSDPAAIATRALRYNAFLASHSVSRREARFAPRGNKPFCGISANASAAAARAVHSPCSQPHAHPNLSAASSPSRPDRWLIGSAQSAAESPFVEVRDARPWDWRIAESGSGGAPRREEESSPDECRSRVLPGVDGALQLLADADAAMTSDVSGINPEPCFAVDSERTAEGKSSWSERLSLASEGGEDDADDIPEVDIADRLPELREMLELLRAKAQQQVREQAEGGPRGEGPGNVFLVGTGPGDPDLLTRQFPNRPFLPPHLPPPLPPSRPLPYPHHPSSTPLRSCCPASSAVTHPPCRSPTPLKAVRALQSADLVLYDRLVSPAILRLAAPGARLLYVGKAAGYHTRTQAEILHLLLAFAEAGAVVVRLKGGDPLVFGRGGEEMEHLQAHGIRVQIVPGITAASGIAADLGVPLTHRGVANSVRFLTGHKRKGGGDPLYAASTAADPDATLVVYMGLATLPSLAARLLANGLPADTPAVAVERGTTAAQRTVFATLEDLPAAVSAAQLVVWVGFDWLHMSRSSRRHVLLVAYTTGFHVWDLHAASPPRTPAASSCANAKGDSRSSNSSSGSAAVPAPSQLVSWRGELVSMLCALPHPTMPHPAMPSPPRTQESTGDDERDDSAGECDRFAACRPLVCVVFPAASDHSTTECACSEHACRDEATGGEVERVDDEAVSGGVRGEGGGWMLGECEWEYCRGVRGEVSGSGGFDLERVQQGSGEDAQGDEEGCELKEVRADASEGVQLCMESREEQAAGQGSKQEGGAGGCGRCNGVVHSSRGNVTGSAARSGGMNTRVAGVTRVALYSLRQHAMVGSVEVEGPVVGVRASGRAIVVVQREQLFCFSPTTLTPTFSLLTHPIPHALLPPSHADHSSHGHSTTLPTPASSHPSASASTPESISFPPPSIPLALGPRWLAYAAPHTPSSPPRAPTLLHSTISPVCPAPVLSPSHPHIMVHDLVSRQPIACFPALEASPLALLQFDPLGVLLAAASLHGTTVGVWRIDGRSSGWQQQHERQQQRQQRWGDGSTAGEGGAVLLYRLQRGLTHSVPRAIAFSPDSSLLALLSAHGTSHLFHIHPFASPPSPALEQPAGQASSPTSSLHLPSPPLSPTSNTRSPHASPAPVLPFTLHSPVHPPPTPRFSLPHNRPSCCALSMPRLLGLSLEAPLAVPTLAPRMRIRGTMLSLWGLTVGRTGAAGVVGTMEGVGAALTAAVSRRAFASTAAAISFAQWAHREEADMDALAIRSSLVAAPQLAQSRAALPMRRTVRLVAPASFPRIARRQTLRCSASLSAADLERLGPNGYGNVVEITSREEFNDQVAKAGDKLVVLDISTRTCGPCKFIFPKVVELSLEHPNAVFLKINGDHDDSTKALMREWGVRAVPNFRFFRGGELVHSHTGAKIEDLKDNLAKFL